MMPSSAASMAPRNGIYHWCTTMVIVAAPLCSRYQTVVLEPGAGPAALIGAIVSTWSRMPFPRNFVLAGAKGMTVWNAIRSWDHARRARIDLSLWPAVSSGE